MAPVVGLVLLIALTVVLSGVVASVVLLVPASGSTGTFVAFELEANATANSMTLTHSAGESVAVDRLSLTVTVGDEPLVHQPPVPFFSAEGFVSGPKGPINPSMNSTWGSGVSSTFALAGTNEPSIGPGDEVRVTVAVDGQVVQQVETRAT